MRNSPRLPRHLLVFALFALLAAGCAVSAHGPRPHFALEVDLGLFYDDLALYGEWVWLDTWGWTWTPHGVPTGWRPYTHGRWVFTDHGWTWISSWPWGWAPFHYGRWIFHEPQGWLWIPGREWAPAWVSWRIGDGWIGWAPLPPDARWRSGDGLHGASLAAEALPGPHAYTFVAERALLDPDAHRHGQPPARNLELIGRTRDATAYDDAPRGAIERGLGLDLVERALGRTVERLRIEAIDRPLRTVDRSLDRDRVRIYRPGVRPGSQKLAATRRRTQHRSRRSPDRTDRRRRDRSSP